MRDGPGGRTTVFMKGCPLRCRWCHNPEGLSPLPQLMIKHKMCRRCGRCTAGCSHPECQPYGRCLHACPSGLVSVIGETYTPEALVSRLLRSKKLYEELGGGVTFSGGEPLLQVGFVSAAAALLRAEGINVAVETCGFSSPEAFERLLKSVDLMIIDLKLIDDGAAREYTGQSSAPILHNFSLLKESGRDFIVRTPLIPGITDTEENLSAIERLIGTGKSADRVKWEKLPYNRLAGAKYPMLGMTYPLEERPEE